MTDELLNQLKAAAEASSSRSRLGRWFTHHHAEFAEILHEYGSAWEAFALTFVERGLLAKPKGWGEPGAVGEVALKRAANTAKQSWFRAQARHRVRDKAPPPHGPERVKPAATAEAVRSGSDMLDGLLSKTNQRSGRK